MSALCSDVSTAKASVHSALFCLSTAVIALTLQEVEVGGRGRGKDKDVREEGKRVK